MHWQEHAATTSHPHGLACHRVLEQFKAELMQRRFADGSSGGGASGATGGTASEAWAQQPALKRARADSGSDLTGAAAAPAAHAVAGHPCSCSITFPGRLTQSDASALLQAVLWRCRPPSKRVTATC